MCLRRENPDGDLLHSKPVGCRADGEPYHAGGCRTDPGALRGVGFSAASAGDSGGKRYF